MIATADLEFLFKFKTPLCKIGELVMTYNVKASNKPLLVRKFYAFYIGPNDSSTGHSVFKLWTKQLLTTVKCKPVFMPEDVFQHMFDKKYKNQSG